MHAYHIADITTKRTWAKCRLNTAESSNDCEFEHRFQIFFCLHRNNSANLVALVEAAFKIMQNTYEILHINSMVEWFDEEMRLNDRVILSCTILDKHEPDDKAKIRLNSKIICYSGPFLS